MINRTITSGDKTILLVLNLNKTSDHTLKTIAHVHGLHTTIKTNNIIEKSSTSVHKNVTRLEISGIRLSVESSWNLVFGRKT